MVIYKGGITGGELGAAIAEAIVHDIRINATGVNGFPQIAVNRIDASLPNDFRIGLVWHTHRTEFDLTSTEAARAIKKMKAGAGHDDGLFKRIQEAFANLEFHVVNDHDIPW